MMKQLSIILCLVFCFTASYSQNIVNRSSNVVTVVDGRLGAGLNFLVPRYADTSSANSGTNLGIDTCGAMIFTYADNSYWLRACSPKRWIKALNTGNLFANNGLTKSGDTIKLGGTLIQNTDINLGGDSLRMTGTGYVRIRALSASVPPLIVENTRAGFNDVAYFMGEHAPVRLFASKTDGFAGFTYYTGTPPVLRWATGYDGVFPHAYIIDLKNGTPGGTFEVEGVTKGGFQYGTGNFYMGSPPTPDTAILNLYRIGSGLTSPSQQIHLNVSNYNSTYNTTGGAITNRMALIDNSASRSSGSNNLTNVGLWLRARNGQINTALYIDSGKFTMHRQFISTAEMSVCDINTVANASTTQSRFQVEVQRSVLYNDTAAGSETLSSALLVRNAYSARGSVTLPDHLSGSGGEIGLFPRRNTAYTGSVLFQGSAFPTNGVVTMPTGLLARFDLTQSQTGSNSLRCQGYWSAFTAWVGMNTGNSIGRFAWINTGAAQETGGSIDTGYAIYINPLPALVTQKYAINQVGPLDSSIFNGPAKFFNIQSDKTITIAGTTGNQTINKVSGTVNFAAAATTITVTNSLVNANSIVICTVRTNDNTAIIKNVVPGVGSFVITLNAAATAETSVGFLVIN